MEKFNKYNVKGYTKAEVKELNDQWEKMIFETGEEMNEVEFLNNFKFEAIQENGK